MKKTALVCGAGGFIGSHLVKRLKKDGYWVRGVDLKYPEFSPTAADEFLILDLREQPNCERAVRLAPPRGVLSWGHSDRPHRRQSSLRPQPNALPGAVGAVAARPGSLGAALPRRAAHAEYGLILVAFHNPSMVRAKPHSTYARSTHAPA